MILMLEILIMMLNASMIKHHYIW